MITIGWSSMAFGQTTYRTGFDTDDERKNWNEYSKGKIGSGHWTVVASGYSKPNCITHSAPTGDADKDSLVNWYVSPKFDFSSGGMIDTLRFNYFTFMGTFFPEQVVQVYALSGSSDPGKATSKVLLADFSELYSDDANLWRDTTGLKIPKLSGEAYIAFKFVAIDGWSSISFDDLQVTANKTSSVHETSESNGVIKVYPNPTDGKITIASLNNVDGVIVVNNLGQVVRQFSGTKEVDLSGLESGAYRLIIKDQNGVTYFRQVIIKPLDE